jgi:hypothetical protein
MDCETAKGLLGSHYDGELDPADRRLVAEHVEHCSACSRELESLAKLDRDSRRLYVPEPPPEIWQRIERRLAVPQTTRQAISNAFSRRQLLVATGAVAVASLGVFVTSTAGRRQQKPAEPEVTPPLQHISIAPNAVLADLSELAPEDRHIVEGQRFCANEECNERLGIGREPIKVVLKNKTVYVCSHECELWVRQHPQQALANVRALEYRQLRKIHIGPSH